MTSFIHLRAHSDYSLGKSIVKIPALIDYAKKLNMSSLCIADYGNLFGSLEFSMECIKKNIKPLIGVVLKIYIDSDNIEMATSQLPELFIIAKDQVGYHNLLQLVSSSFLKNRASIPHVTLDDLLFHAGGLIILFNAFHSPIAHLIKNHKYAEAENLLQSMHKHFNHNMFLELIRTKNNQWHSHEQWYLEQAFKRFIPLVATNPIAFLKPELSEAHDAALCIANGTYILEDNREKSDPDHYFKNEKEMLKLFSDLPEAIENTKLISIKASIFPEQRKPMLPKFSDAIDDECLELERQAHEGLSNRLDNIGYSIDHSIYFQRLEFELSVINKMQFPGYFLIVSDFIKWSKANNIPVGPGRGSGAGSLVAWALEITDLDPVKFGLLFERFLNPERISMPDFDIDFCQERRDEVINYVKHKYGEDRVAQIITFGKLQARAVLRDVGRVMQIPYGLVDKICKMVPNNPANPVTLSEAIALDRELKSMEREDKDLAKLLSISLELEGINRHASTHAAGIIIADRPLIELVPLYMDSNSSMQTIQYSLKYADAAGLMKFDFLGLKTLTVISYTIDFIKRNRNLTIDLHALNYEDEITYKMLSCGNTLGVFQFEGASVKDAIKHLKPDSLNDIIALTSLNRPGPMDNIPSYINRKHGKELPEYIHPKLENLLQETYGIIIYQEQVMQIAQILGGYTLGEADLLRKAMGKKNKQEMEEQKVVFIKKCVDLNDITETRAHEIFALIEKFASYGFNKSHAAAYAIISYQTAYLKAHYAPEFLAASMNLEIHDTAKIGMFCNDAKFLGIEIMLPDINHCDASFKVIDHKIYYGLAAIKGVGINAMQEIQNESANGKFKSIVEFIERCKKSLNKRMLENLVKAGALDSLYDNRAELFHNIEKLLKHIGQDNNTTTQGSLFGNEETQFTFIDHADWSQEQKLIHEFESIGFYLSDNPLTHYDTQLKSLNIMNIETVQSTQVHLLYKCRVAGILSSKRVRSSKHSKYAFIQLLDNTGILDVSIFNEKLLIESGTMLEEGNALVCDLEMKNDANGMRIIAEKIMLLNDAIASAIECYGVYIKKKIDIHHVTAKLKDHGVSVKLYAELEDGSIIQFALDRPIYIDHAGVSELKDLYAIKIIESVK